jgi:Recombinase
MTPEPPSGPAEVEPADDLAGVLPWRQSLLPAQAGPACEPAGPDMVPVAWLGRTSTEDAQDPTISLPRQLRNSRDALPDGFVIVAHFFDVESGRKDLADRGRGHAHERFAIPVPRDGGIADLLEEAVRPDRRFVAVVCESIERVARRTYFGTKVEYELEQSGVALLAADEPLPASQARPNGRSAKRATPILTRRVKQAIAEWYVLQMLELSWDGFCTHTEQGWNIGKPCYGYQADKIPHPVPAKRAEGRTKTRLLPDPVRGPVLTRILHHRALGRLGYDAIADRLNADPDANPPPQPVDPARAVGRWTGSAVREILRNPKYTGYMVWNRRASKKGGRCNPPSEWVWSPAPTHEPLVTKALFEAAAATSRVRQGSRTASGPSRHPQAARSYPLRSYVVCELCGRRMFGKTRRDLAYYACEPDQRHHAQRSSWQPGQPASLWVREDILLDVVHGFFAERIFGPDRRKLLATQLASHAAPAETPDRSAERARALRHAISDIERRKRALIAELEAQPVGGDPGDDPDAARQYRQAIQHRFTELVAEHRAKTDEFAQLAEHQDQPGSPDSGLLAALPELPLRLAGLPEHLQRGLYDAFQLQVRYHRPRHEVTIRVTIRADGLDYVNGTVAAITSQQNAENRSPVLGAPPAGFEPAHTAPEAASLYRADQRKHGGGRTGRARMGRGAVVIRALARCCRRLEPTAPAEERDFGCMHGHALNGMHSLCLEVGL